MNAKLNNGYQTMKLKKYNIQNLKPTVIICEQEESNTNLINMTNVKRKHP